MPLFEGSKIISNSRSHATLVKSQGDSPSERFQIDPSLRGLFDYHYAGWARSKVVIPKGTIVSVNKTSQNYRSLTQKTNLTFAGHGKNAIGVAPYNFMRRFGENGEEIHDVFESDDFVPGIITRDYIEVPYIPNPFDVYTDPANAESRTVDVLGNNAKNDMKFFWGCATNLKDQWDLYAADGSQASLLEEGDFVVAGPYGKFVKFDETVHNLFDIVGQVLALETDLPPEGWLQWVTPEVEKPGAGYANGNLRDPYEPSAPPTAEGPYYSPDYKWPLTSDYRAPGAWKTYNGIPGMTDGGMIKMRNASGSIASGEQTVKIYLDPVFKADKTSIKVTIAGVDTDGFTYTESENSITVDNGEAAADNLAVKVVYNVVDNKGGNFVGTPTAWDFVGSVGAARILLKL